MFKPINNKKNYLVTSNSYKDYLKIINNNLSDLNYLEIYYKKHMKIDNILSINTIEINKIDSYFEIIHYTYYFNEYLNYITDIKKIINKNNFICINVLKDKNTHKLIEGI